MTDQAVMLRVCTIAKQAGVDPVTPNDLRRTYLTELERKQLDARTKGRPEGYRIRDAARSVPSAIVRESSRRG